MNELDIKPIIRDTSANKATLVIYGNSKLSYGAIRIRSADDKYWFTKIKSLPEDQMYGEKFIFKRLNSNTTYQYQATVFSDLNKPNWKSCFKGKFQTDDPDSNDLTFAFGSCRYFVQLTPKISIGKNKGDRAFQEINSMIEQGQPIKLLLNIGDQIYTDTIKLFPRIRIKSRTKLDALHRTAKSTSGLSTLMSKIETKTIEDDHAYRDNGDPMIGSTEPEVYQNCLDFVNVYDHPEGPFPFGSDLNYGLDFDRGSFKFFLMDTRYGRSEKGIMTKDQWKKLEKWLVSDQDRILFLISPIPMFFQQFSDTWHGYLNDLNRLVKIVVKNKIKNLVVLSGDAHSGVAAEFRILGYDLKIVEILSSGFYALFHDRPSKFFNNLYTPKYHLKTKESLSELRSRVISNDNFAVVRANHKNQKVQVKYFSRKGKLLRTHDFHL